MEKEKFGKTVSVIAIPVALQCMLQSSFSIIDQIMIGELGEVNIAAVGLAGKFSSIFSVVVAAVGAVGGIMIAQYMGAKDEDEVDRSFSLNMMVAVLIAVLFMMLCISCPKAIMGLYTGDVLVRDVAAGYLQFIAHTFLPIAIATMLATMLRCMEKAFIPLIASIIAAIVNTGLNYVLIFGKFGIEKMGVTGAAFATIVAQVVNMFIMLGAMLWLYYRKKKRENLTIRLGKMTGKQYLIMLFPILANEFLWSLGENVYAAIYGNLGTDECAAMTLTYAIQGLTIGALSGLSQAAGIIIGKELGKKEYEMAYVKAKKIVVYGFLLAMGLAVLVIALKGFYVDIFNVQENVKETAKWILVAFAILSPVKVLNMILAGGILRSGGETKLVMYIDLIGTWGIGVPLGVLASAVFKLPIPWVYFILSLEEVVRLLIAVVFFKKKKWMKSIS